MIINIRQSDGEWFASPEGTELEGSGETPADAIRELAENMELKFQIEGKYSD